MANLVLKIWNKSREQNMTVSMQSNDSNQNPNSHSEADDTNSSVSPETHDYSNAEIEVVDDEPPEAVEMNTSLSFDYDAIINIDDPDILVTNGAIWTLF